MPSTPTRRQFLHYVSRGPMAIAAASMMFRPSMCTAIEPIHAQWHAEVQIQPGGIQLSEPAHG